MVREQIGNVHEYTVSELSGAVKRAIEDNFGLVRVKGELGRVTRAASGHVYLDLKDEKAALSGVMWKGMAARLSINPEQGMEVVATGRMTTFPGQSRYQIIIDSLEPAGVGALMALFEERKKKLAAEGLFAPERKKPIPFLPDVIGVVTSPSGAVIRDILHRLRERFPRHVIVWPTVVQGRGAEEKIAAAINGFNALSTGDDVPRPDVLIVARGGGSLEDLWCFNEEVVARAVAASDIPVISAVGHETDTTLIDYVSDKRAPTPTAAAEFAAPVRSELLSEVLNKERRMVGAAAQLLDARRNALRSAERGLGRPEDVLGAAQQLLDRRSDQLTAALRARASAARTVFAEHAARLSAQSLRNTIERKQRDVVSLETRLRAAAVRMLERRHEIVGDRAGRLTITAIERAIAEHRRSIGQTTERLVRNGGRLLRDRRDRLESKARLLESYAYKNVLARGFALVRNGDGKLIRRAEGAPASGPGEIEFADGARSVTFSEGPKGQKKPQKNPAKKPVTAKQQRLFD